VALGREAIGFLDEAKPLLGQVCACALEELLETRLLVYTGNGHRDSTLA
jgi:hypothetical protein